MKSRMLGSAIGLLCITGSALATLPDPNYCTVTPCDNFLGMVIYPQPNPGGVAEFTINVRNGDNLAIPAAYVEVIFLVPGNHCFCPTVVLDGLTDAFGNITFNISAGGCTTGEPAVQIVANDTPIRQYDHIKGGDWAPEADCNVGLGDFIFFGNNYSPTIAGCTDYFNDGGTGLDDFIALGEMWGHDCAW